MTPLSRLDATASPLTGSVVQLAKATDEMARAASDTIHASTLLIKAIAAADSAGAFKTLIDAVSKANSELTQAYVDVRTATTRLEAEIEAGAQS